jgi:choline dehydrogenase-like flavoprotein
LLEAGGSDKHPFVSMPKGLAKIMADPQRTWMYRAEPEQANAFSQQEYWARGRLMGGSSSINGMMYVRGMPADFDEIAAQSSADWSWQHIGAAYKALEAHELGADATRGDSGPLKLTVADRRTPLTDAMIEAGTAMGLRRKIDVNSPDDDPTVGYASRTIWNGRRQSASVAFIDPIRQRKNLMVMTGALTDKILFDGHHARSVSVLMGAKKTPIEIRARREIIIAAGAMASPGILQRSGIGGAELLRELGIPVIVDNPQVGEHLIEHRGIMVQWKVRADSDNAQYSGWKLLRNVARYYLTRTGPMSSAAYEVGAWFKSNPQAARPDIQFLISAFSFDYATTAPLSKKIPAWVLSAIRCDRLRTGAFISTVAILPRCRRCGRITRRRRRTES